MRKFIVVALALIGLLFCGNAYADLNDGLVAYYPFNGNADDESINSNDGAVEGATLTENILGNADSAYSFDNGSYINIISNEALKLTNELTISAWIYFEGGSINPRVISYGGSDYSSGYCLLTYGTGDKREICFSFGGVRVRSDTILLSKTWYFVLGIGRTTGVEIYINGELDKTESGTPSGFNYSHDMNIGRKSTSSYDYWGGYIDDIRIYNRTLSESEIQQLYNETESDCPDSCTQAELDEKYNEGYNDGVATCEGCTQTQLDEKYEEGKQHCIDYPDECGIDTNGEYTQADIDAKYEEGRQYCIDHPEECGIEVGGDYQDGYDEGYQSGLAECSNGSCSPVKLSSDLNMHIPELTYETLLGSMNLWVDMEFAGENNDGDLLWKLIDLGEKQ